MLRAGATTVAREIEPQTAHDSLLQLAKQSGVASTAAAVSAANDAPSNDVSGAKVAFSHTVSSNSGTLKEHENVMKQKEKEIFNLKMRIYFLEKVVEKNTPKGLQSAVLETCQLKEENERLKTDKLHVDAALVKAYETMEALQSASEVAGNNLKAFYGAEIDTLVQKIAVYKDQSITLSSENASLNSAKESLQKDVEKFKTELTDALNTLTDTKVLLEERTQSLSCEIETLQKNFVDLTATSESTIADLTKQNEHLQGDYKVLDAKQAATLIELEKINAQLRTKEAENARLLGEIDLLQLTLDQKNTIISQKSEEVANANTKIVYLSKDLSTQQQTLQQKSTFFSELKSKESVIEGALENTKRELCNALEDIAHYRLKSERLEEELSDAQKRLSTSQSTISSLHIQMEQLQKEHQGSVEKYSQAERAKLVDLNVELDACKHQIETLKIEKSTLEATRNDLDSRLASLQQKVFTQNNELADLRSKLDAAEASKTISEKTLQTTKQQLEETQQKLESERSHRMIASAAYDSQESESWKTKLEHVQAELQTQQALAQKLSDEKVRLELALDQTKTDKTAQKQRLQDILASLTLVDRVDGRQHADYDDKVYDTNTFDAFADEDNLADALAQFKQQFDRFYHAQLQSLLADAAEKLMQMYRTVEGVPRLVSLDSSRGHSNASDAGRYLDALFHEIGSLLSEHVATLRTRLNNTEKMLQEKTLEHENALAQKSVQLTFYGQKIEKYRKLLHKKEHFINKALEQLDVINNLPLVFADASASNATAALINESSSTW